MSTNIIEAKVFACTQSESIGKEIASSFGVELGKISFHNFSDGEYQPSFEETIRGSRIFLIGSTNPNSENLMELLLMIDAAKRASARHITAVIPYFGWARQDRKDKPRVPIGAKLIAKLIETAGATRIITMDLHADQIQGFFEKPVDHLYASTIFIPYIQNLKLDNLTIASPDMGGSKRAYAYSKFLNCNVVICYKQREKANIISHMEVIGNVVDKNVVLGQKEREDYNMRNPNNPIGDPKLNVKFTDATTRHRDKTTTKYYIELPMPQELNDSNSVTWGDD